MTLVSDGGEDDITPGRGYTVGHGGIGGVTIGQSVNGNPGASVGQGHGGGVGNVGSPYVNHVFSNSGEVDATDYRFVLGDVKLLYANMGRGRRTILDLLMGDQHKEDRYGFLPDSQLAILHGLLESSLRQVLAEERRRFGDEYEPPKTTPTLKKRPTS